MRTNLFSLTLATLALATLTPLAALALPAVGDMIGTDPETAKAALEKAGCMLDAFEAEDGKIEAKCKDAATGKAVEVYIDPASGNVVDIKEND
ncbi:MAG: PepSY domain-containing protein [Rhodobacterales bacterium]|nr:PepSY domain-containing protein [Rhodobacterales bacterium]